MDWGEVDLQRLARLACPMCGRSLSGGLMRQVEWSPRRCVIVVGCANCGSESLAMLDPKQGVETSAPIDVDDVRAAHEMLTQSSRVADLFLA
jgi:formate dehydrogenase assembly factor FdhD